MVPGEGVEMKHRLRSAEHRHGRVVLCGSMRNLALMSDLVELLKHAGIDSVAPTPDTDMPLTINEARAQKREASLHHFRLIKERVTSALLVVNLDKDTQRDYIGPNAFAEIAVAFAEGVPVYLLQASPEYYREELEAWEVTPLNGDLARFVEDVVGPTLYADQLQARFLQALVS